MLCGIKGSVILQLGIAGRCSTNGFCHTFPDNMIVFSSFTATEAIDGCVDLLGMVGVILLLSCLL